MLDASSILRTAKSPCYQVALESMQPSQAREQLAFTIETSDPPRLPGCSPFGGLIEAGIPLPGCLAYLPTSTPYTVGSTQAMNVLTGNGITG